MNVLAVYIVLYVVCCIFMCAYVPSCFEEDRTEWRYLFEHIMSGCGVDTLRNMRFLIVQRGLVIGELSIYLFDLLTKLISFNL
jgi:hypothetical protein